MIANDYFWWNILWLCLGTISIRYSFIAFSARIVISDRMKEIFSFIPSAVLPAIIAPAVFFHQGTVSYLQGKERLVVLVLSTVVCYLTKSTLLTIGFGLLTLFALHSF